MMSLNPFIYSRSLNPSEFDGRRSELNKILGRLATGQSVAVVGQPHIGKTSLLEYIHDNATRQANFGNQFDNFAFTLMDMLAAQSLKSPKDFWQYALKPIASLDGFSSLLEEANKEDYSNLVLEPLFNALHASGHRLAMLLDEFDSLLSHTALNTPEFYAGLRTLASRSGGLILIISTRKSLDILNNLTQNMNPHGSPYFNVFVEIQLGALKKDALDVLFNRSGDILTTTDRDYILRVSGRHPYLAQTAAAMLWDAHDEGFQGKELYRIASQNLYRQSRQHFSDSWNFWTNAMRKAVTAIALAQIPRLLDDHHFKVSELVEDFDDFSPELDALQVSGILDKNQDDEWIVSQDALLWWLADELRRNVRDETAFGDWIRAQEMDNLLTQRDKERLGSAANSVLSLLGKGSATLIETLAKGFGEAIIKK
jgi:hypothetical protein